MNTVTRFTYDKNDYTDLVFKKATKECTKRANTLNSFKKWTTYNYEKVGQTISNDTIIG